MVIFKDEALINYYNNEEQRLIKPFFIQRIIDSGLYLIIFPSGLLMLIGFTPLSMEADTSCSIEETPPKQMRIGDVVVAQNQNKESIPVLCIQTSTAATLDEPPVPLVTGFSPPSLE